MGSQTEQQKVVITGSRGFIGSRLCRRLESCVDVTEVDLLAPTPVDIRDMKALEKACEGATLIYHLASISSYDACQADPDLARSTNVDGTNNIFKLAKKIGAKVVFASSAAVYGTSDTPCAEYFTPDPQGLYALTKRNGEILADEYWQVPCCCVRIFNVYGAGSKGCIEKFLNYQKYHDGQAMFISNDGKAIRDFIHVDDVVEALIQIAERLELPKFPTVLNLGTGQGTKINTLATLIKYMAGNEDAGIWSYDKPDDVPYSVADPKLLNNIINFTPRNILTGLEAYFK